MEIESFNNAGVTRWEYHRDLTTKEVTSRTVYFEATYFAARGIYDVLKEQYGLTCVQIHNGVNNQYRVTWALNHIAPVKA
jgi:hypothetical protein